MIESLSMVSGDKIRENNLSHMDTKYGTFTKLTREAMENDKRFTKVLSRVSMLPETLGENYGILNRLFDIYIDITNNTNKERILAGVTCLICCKTFIIDIHDRVIRGVMKNHLFNKHMSERVLDEEECRVSTHQMILRIVDREILPDEVKFANDCGYDVVEEFKNTGINSYMCYFCGVYYAVTPSLDIAFSHLKKCSYLGKYMNKKMQYR